MRSHDRQSTRYSLDHSRPEGMERAYVRHGRGVYATAYGILGNDAQAQDVAHDVFLGLWRSPEKFDPRRGELGSYLRLRARSRALDVWRSGQAAGRAGDRLQAVAVRDEDRVDGRPDAAHERREQRDIVRSALRRLPAHQREALVLAYWGGLTAAEIACRSHIPLGTAKSRLRVGLAKLREQCGPALESSIAA